MKIGYARISKTDKSQLLDLQIEALKKAGVLQEHTYVDKISDKDDDCPAFESCLSAIRENDTLIVWSLDRLGSRLKDLINTVDDLSNRNVEFKVINNDEITIDTSLPGGKIIFGIFASLAKFEREQTSIGLNVAKDGTQKNEAGLGIFFNGLQQRDQAIFDKVIACKSALGLKTHTTHDSSTAELIIIAEEKLSDINVSSKQAVIVVTDNSDSDLGGFNISRPMAILAVRKVFDEAIKFVQQRLNNSHNNKQEKPSLKENTSSHAGDVKLQTGFHALVIDDSKIIHTQLDIELEGVGITADFVESGEQALEKSKQLKYDLIFLDIMMAGMDGYETCKRLRATSAYKKTPIIMLSGKTSPLDEVKGVMVGATTYLTKPIESVKFQKMLNRVTKWLNNFSK